MPDVSSEMMTFRKLVSRFLTGDLVVAYSIVLENNPGVVSETLLPAAKKEIKRALISSALSDAHKSLEWIDLHRAAYMLLSNFRSPEDESAWSAFHGDVDRFVAMNETAKKREFSEKRIFTAEFVELGERVNAIDRKRRDDLIMLELEFDCHVCAHDDIEKAIFQELIDLASKGHRQAQYQLGYKYQVGKGVPKNASVAAYWFEKSAVEY